MHFSSCHLSITHMRYVVLETCNDILTRKFKMELGTGGTRLTSSSPRDFSEDGEGSVQLAMNSRCL